MLYNGLQMDIFIRELRKLLGSIVVKRNVLADKYETVESMQDAELFILAKDGMAEFSSFYKFDYEVYKLMGYSESEIIKFNTDKENIPYGVRDRLVELEVQYIIANYVEKNDYYRMLSGLPDMSDKQLIFAPENDVDVSTKIPIYQLDSGSVKRLESSGILDYIKSQYPDKKYLNYLGFNAIDIYKARKALNYELLYFDVTDPENICYEFKRFYSHARDYYMIGMYNNNIAHSYEYYDNFIGFCILIMAVQRTFASVFTTGITRDFYDPQLIRYLFDSYSIPYIENMSINQLKLLAKNLNIFLMFKSSDKVLFDLCAVFGFTNVNIYKYLICRNHITDSNDKPIFPTKTVVFNDGTIETGIPDYDKMFEIYFQRVNIKSKDINAALLNYSEKLSYKDMTSGDIYWVDSEELRNKIYNTSLNYIESKYMGIDIMYHVTDIMYEVNHVFRMIIDKNKDFRKIYVNIGKASSKDHDLYSLVIFLCAFFCKRYGFTGEIPLHPSSIASVYGFNFNADLRKIASDILQSKYLDDSMVQYILNFSVIDIDDVTRIYHNIKTLKDFIVEQMALTKDIEVYKAYKKLYKSVLIVEDKKTLYKKNNGQYASTYEDLLSGLDSELYIYYKNFDYSNKKYFAEIFSSLLYRLENLSSEFEYFHYISDYSILLEILIKLINFFKSYTVDLSHAGMVFILDDRYFNMLKVLDLLWETDITWWIYDGLKNKFYDLIKDYFVDGVIGTEFPISEQLWMEVLARVSTKLDFKDILYGKVDWNVLTKLNVFDFNNPLIKNHVNEYLTLISMIGEYIIDALMNDKINIKEYFGASMNWKLKTGVNAYDILGGIVSMSPEGRYRIYDRIAECICKRYVDLRLNIREDNLIKDLINIRDDLWVRFKDTLRFIFHECDIIKFSETLNVFILAYIKTLIIFEDKMHTFEILNTINTEEKIREKNEEFLHAEGIESMDLKEYVTKEIDNLSNDKLKLFEEFSISVESINVDYSIRSKLIKDLNSLWGILFIKTENTLKESLSVLCKNLPYIDNQQIDYFYTGDSLRIHINNFKEENLITEKISSLLETERESYIETRDSVNYTLDNELDTDLDLILDLVLAINSVTMDEFGFYIQKSLTQEFIYQENIKLNELFDFRLIKYEIGRILEKDKYSKFVIPNNVDHISVRETLKKTYS